MSDPFNKLPTDPAWARAVDDACEAAAKAVDGCALLIAIQPLGKLAVASAGVPPGSPIEKKMEDIPGMLIELAMVIAQMQAADMANPRTVN